jgi:hypothetical protein
LFCSFKTLLSTSNKLVKNDCFWNRPFLKENFRQYFTEKFDVEVYNLFTSVARAASRSVISCDLMTKICAL